MPADTLPSAVAHYLEQLLPHSSATVYGAILSVLSAWIREQFQGPSARQTQSDTLSRFESLVEVEARNRRLKYPRRPFPDGAPLPNLYVDWGTAKEIEKEMLPFVQGLSPFAALEFLAQLTAAWILCCPEAIIRSDPAFSGYAASVRNEADLVYLLRRWLNDELLRLR
jgi:hypothetical protein